jgi:hypothetical protein
MNLQLSKSRNTEASLAPTISQELVKEDPFLKSLMTMNKLSTSCLLRNPLRNNQMTSLKEKFFLAIQPLMPLRTKLRLRK